MSHRLSNTISLVTLLISLTSVIIVGAIWIAYDYNTFSKNLKELKTHYILEEQSQLKNEVERAVSMIAYSYSLRYERTKVLVKERVDEAHLIMTDLYTNYKDTKSKAQILELFRNSLRNLRFFDGVGYYFMYALDGPLLMHGFKPEYENTYELNDFVDLNGKKVVDEFFQIAKEKKEGHLEWTFFRPDKTDVQANKIGYVKLFEPLNYVIATADYVSQVENELKTEILSRIRNIQYGKDGYIFVLKTDGTLLVNKTFASYEGKDTHEIKEKKLKEAVSKILKFSQTNDDGFLQYDLQYPHLKEISKKMTYIKVYKKWDLIIGTGQSLNDLEAMLENKQKELTQRIMDEISYAILVILIVLVLVFLVNKFFTRRIKENIKVFVNFFNQLNQKNKLIQINDIQFTEFTELAQIANEMLHEKLQNEKVIDTQNKEVQINHTLLNEYKKAVDAGAIVSKTDAKGKITYVNDEFCKISGFSREELLGNNHSIVRHPDMTDRIFKNLWDTISSKRIWKGVLQNKAKNGETYYVKSSIVPILDIEGNINEFMAIRYDVSDLIKKSKQIKDQTTDPLTKLPNREKLLQDITNKNDLKLAIFNIVRFKEINEYYGFEMGDKLLIRLGNALSLHIADDNITLYRLQGDEYAILGNQHILPETFKSICYEIIEAFKNFTFNIDENNFDIRLVGGASFQSNYFVHAEMAKNYARTENCDFIFFDENTSIKENLIRNIDWTQKLKRALQKEQIVVFTQPIVCNVTCKIKKYECLVRLIDDEQNIISPFHFLQVAKKSGLYSQITQRVIAQSFAYFHDKEDEFSINLTIEDIMDSSTVTYIQDQLLRYEDISKRVIFEIVEDEGIENFDDVIQFIETMKQLGCRIAIDDFGTGYSNFDYLMKLNVDFVKIDGSMIKHLDTDKNAQVVTELIVSFSKKLGIKTIAEFVHKEEIEQMVKKMDIDFSQGFYLGEPKRIDS